MPRMARPEFTCTVRVQYLPEQSNPTEAVYSFAYTVTIRNSGKVTAQLVARQWLISDAHGREEEVRGLAVVGHQPLLKQGKASSTPVARDSIRPTARCAAPSSA